MTGTESSPDKARPIDGARSSVVGDAKDEFSAYLEYNRVLRSWFVAFGVGGPALFLINEQLGKRLAEKGQLRVVGAMFLIGTGSQVLGAVVNKIGNWYVYRGALDSAYRMSLRYKFFKWFVLQFCFDIILDIVTIAFFGLATWHLLTVFGSG